MAPISNNCGIGLRHPHYQEILSTSLKVNWLEVHSENFFNKNAKLHNMLARLACKYNLSFHCVGLSLGSSDELNKTHLRDLKELIDLYNPALVSDHLSWSSVEGTYLHNLLPLPYNHETFELFRTKVDSVQTYLGRQLLIENPSQYISFPENTLSEVDFLNKLADKTGCGILLDINNLYISCHNLSQNPKNYLDNIEPAIIKEIHLAGFEENKEGVFIDTHSHPPSLEVIKLFEYFIKKYGAKPTLFEQDQNLSSLTALTEQALEIDAIIDRAIN